MPMETRMRFGVAALIPMALLAVATVAAVKAYGQAATEAAASPYAPSLSEMMTGQQERHIKLWFAGRARNWPLADYEVGQLEDGFDDIGKLLGGDLIDKQVGGPLKALEKAVADKDRRVFEAAFDTLSAGCNSCHHTLDHAFIVIQRPALLPYSNQSFAPPTK
jgi:hypothetical protein